MDPSHHTKDKNDRIDLYDAILLLKDRAEVLNFLKDLCTPQELQAFNERWHVCTLLKQGDLSYRAISEITGTSLATIVRVARFFKDEPFQGYRTVLDRAQQRRKKA
jgi:TrpR-related protein YerC/YecD